MFPGGWPKALGSGIYWYGPDDQVEAATGSASQFYDPSRKTIVFIDGFNGLYHIKSCHRMTSKCVPLAKCEPGSELFAVDWISKGWNFGIFYWDQFADEDCYYKVELKIWGYGWDAGGNEEQHLKWKSYDTVSERTEAKVYEGNETSVAEICASSVRSAMPAFHGGSFQIVGFSAGAQLAAACADVLHTQTPTHPALPTQLVMLEPAFTGHFKPWSVFPLHPCTPIIGSHDKQTVKWAVQAVERLYNRSVPMSLYKSSRMSRFGSVAELVFDPGVELDVLGTLVRWIPNFCGVLDFACQHDVVVPYYFFSMRDAPAVPVLENEGLISGSCKMPGPHCTDAEILDLAKQRRAGITDDNQPLWKQVSGFKTWTIEDDVFRWDVSKDPDAPLPTTGLYEVGGFTKHTADVNKTPMVLCFLLGAVIVAYLRFGIMRLRYSRIAGTDTAEEAPLVDGI
jgi:hypothetical protein